MKYRRFGGKYDIGTIILVISGAKLGIVFGLKESVIFILLVIFAAVISFSIAYTMWLKGISVYESAGN